MVQGPWDTCGLDSKEARAGDLVSPALGEAQGCVMHDQLPLGFNDNAEELTRDEETLLGALQYGRENAMPMKSLAEEVDVNTRTIQQMIHHLIVDHKKAIGSTSKAPAGYFLIASEAELKDAVKHLNNRAMSVLHRMAALSKCSMSELLGQMKIGETVHGKN